MNRYTEVSVRTDGEKETVTGDNANPHATYL